jgi:hypothetical protein
MTSFGLETLKQFDVPLERLAIYKRKGSFVNGHPS